MECASKPTKPSSNISDIVSKFAKVCKFRSIGVFSSENPDHPPHKIDGNGFLSSGEDSSDATTTTTTTTDDPEGDIGGATKIYPHLIENQEKGNDDGYGHVEMLKLFDMISELKFAYVQLQQAHIPYDPDKIKAADELVFAQLDGLCKIKRAIKEKKQFEKAGSNSACLDILLSEIDVQERLLEKLKAQAKEKDAVIDDLKRELRDLGNGIDRLVEEIKRKERDNLRSMNFSSIHDIVQGASKAIHDFAKPLIALMKVSGWDLDRATNSIEDSVMYSKRSHKKYAFEAYIARRMFCGFSFQSYNVDKILKFHDPLDALIDNPCSAFAKFCRTKYLLVVHPKMEMSFFGNLDQRKFVSCGRHPRTPFYQLFIQMARWVWVLQGIGASVDAKAEIFRVKRGSEFSDVYMQYVEEKEDRNLSDKQERFKVEFMIMPGFVIGETIIRSQVYLSKLQTSNAC